MMTLSLQVKLASIVVHADEFSDLKKSHVFDLTVLRQLLDDPEVKEWIASLGPLAPVKR